MRAPPPPAHLPTAYVAAWRRIVADLHADPEVLGATISGSVLRGEGGPTSDLDVYVLIAGDARRRRTFECEGVLVEEFRNPEAWIRRYLAQGSDAPAFHMLGHGEVVLDRDARFAPIRAEARRLYDDGPRALSPEQETWERYLVWDAWCDVKDLLSVGEDVSAQGLMQWHLPRVLTAHHRLRRRWLPKAKRLLADLRAWDGPLAAQVEAFWGFGGHDSHGLFERFDLVVRHVLAPHDPDHPMLWESRPQRIDDACG